ncbi:hypothetical protein THIOM_004622 [Candidatus Thiomargarita nelsonii]|uniref:Uncharacterized protein n=1 Tax=Candidatus Thiomargarita nelsonii TaxID=1003181 RepID=A0A176RVF6_9GAMM|nr:hypothetical protein THIOM_004622 [Candidatus Thiomargarita nelsonii]
MLQKTKFVTLQDSYHGETLGTLAVGDVAQNEVAVPLCETYLR